MRCKGKTKSGKPCTREAKDHYCWQHQSELENCDVKNDSPQSEIKSLELTNGDIDLKIDQSLQQITIKCTQHRDFVSPKDNQYLRLRLIDKGSFSSVYLIIYLHKYMALKEISCNESFNNEIKILKTLSYPDFHKGIVGLYKGVPKKQTQKYNLIFLEYIEGVSLSKLLKMGPIPEVYLDFIILNCIETLKYIHSKKIVHRDIKLENIIVGLNTLKFIDFAFSTHIRSKISILGTAYYIAPELWEYEKLKNEDLDHSEILRKADVYALGVTFYILVNQKYPFPGMQNLSKIEYGNLVVTSEPIICKSGTKYDTLITKMLTKNYKDRPYIHNLDL